MALYGSAASMQNQIGEQLSRDDLMVNVSMVRSNNSKIVTNFYEPQEDYVFVPVTETDPWYTPSYIQTGYTDGGEFYTKRADDTEPTSQAQTYVGPYFTWVKEPPYSENAKNTYGTIGNIVIGQGYYGINGFGKPKNQGLTSNRILTALTEIVRTNLGGPVMADIVGRQIPDVVGREFSALTKQNALNDFSVNLDEVAPPSPNIPDAIHIKNTGKLRFVHTPNQVTLTTAKDVLDTPGTDLVSLAPPAKRFGLKGRAPRITNQPNAKFDFGA